MKMITNIEEYKKLICPRCAKCSHDDEKCLMEKIVISESADGCFTMKCENFGKVGKSPFSLIILHYEDGIKEYIVTDIEPSNIGNFDPSDLPLSNVCEYICKQLHKLGYIALTGVDVEDPAPNKYQRVYNIVL